MQIFQLREIYKQFTTTLEFLEFLLLSFSSRKSASSNVHFYKFLLWSPFHAIHNATCQGQAGRVEERTNFLAKVRVHSFFSLSSFLFFLKRSPSYVEFRKEVVVFAQLDGIGFLSTAITYVCPASNARKEKIWKYCAVKRNEWTDKNVLLAENGANLDGFRADAVVRWTFESRSRSLEKDRDIAIMMWASWMKSEKVVKVTVVRSLDRFYLD